jgi:hypothetical protein
MAIRRLAKTGFAGVDLACDDPRLVLVLVVVLVLVEWLRTSCARIRMPRGATLRLRSTWYSPHL